MTHSGCLAVQNGRRSLVAGTGDRGWNGRTVFGGGGVTRGLDEFILRVGEKLETQWRLSLRHVQPEFDMVYDGAERESCAARGATYRTRGGTSCLESESWASDSASTT